MSRLPTGLGLVLLFVASNLLSSCGLMYSSRRAELLETASLSDFGSPPPEGHQKVEREVIDGFLKDPGSAQFKWGTTQRDAIQAGFASPNPVLVWISNVSVNAKNGFGGYVGFKAYQFAWRDGRMFAYMLGDGIWRYLE